MAYFYSRKLRLPFSDVIAKLAQNLQQQEFGIITTIDVRDTFRAKLNLNFRNYKIISACNPEYAYKAISLDSHIGVMLPCNIVVQEHENGEVEVSAVNPMEAAFDKGSDTTELTQLAAEVTNRLRAAVDDLQREIPGQNHEEALPAFTRRETQYAPLEDSCRTWFSASDE